MPRYPRSTEPRPSRPRTKRVPAMSVRPLVPVETRPSQIQAESSSSGGTGWSENAWEDTPTITTKPPRGPKIVEYCNKPGQFWPDGQEPPFEGQKHRRRVFVTKGRRQPREEITNNLKEINRLKEDVRPTQSFTPRTGDILVYHDYSDYEGSDEDDFFESLDDEDLPTSVLPSLPPPIPDPTVIDDASIPSMIVELSHAKWMVESKVLDPDDIELLSQILDIPAAAYYKLLPPSGSVVADFLKFKLPDMDDADFTQEIESAFNEAPAVGRLRIPVLIPPKAWVRSLRDALNTAIRHGKRSIIHPLLPQQPLPLWILALWEKAHVVREVHISWTNAHKWLEGKLIENPRSSSPESYENFSTAMDYMLRLPHRKFLQGQSSTGRINTSQFTRLLSDNTLLSDTLIDLMVQVMNLRKRGVDKSVMILDTELPDSIRRNEMHFNKSHDLIYTLRGWGNLYFPVCIPELSHFVAFNIDFRLVSFCYGDSLNLPASKLSPFIVKLQRWLELHFGRPFKNCGNTLPHSTQKDNVSCGLFAMNAIAHGAFLDPLGVDNPASTRAWWFKRIAGPHATAPPTLLPASTTAPLPPLPSSTPTTAPPPPPSTQSHSLPTAQTEEVEGKEQRLLLIRRYKDKANTRAAEKARLEQDKEAQEHNMEVDVKEAQTPDVEMILEGERMEENARLEELERFKELERQKEIERREEQARLEGERLEELAREEELRKKEIERREEQARLEREQLEELARQEEQGRLERERLEEIARVEELERKNEIERREEQARLERERLEELARQEEFRQKEIERREEQARLERERLEDLAREEELRKKEIQRREEQARLERERLEDLARQEELTQKESERVRLEELERQKQRERVEGESLKASQTLHLVPNDSMDVDIEPGQLDSEPIIKVRELSLRRARMPNVAHPSRRSISPCRQGSSSRRAPSPTRPTTYRDYAPSRLDRLAPPRRRTPSPERFARRRRSPSPERFARRRRSPSPERFAPRRRSPSPERFTRRRRSPSPNRSARRGRFLSPTGDRGYEPQPNRNQSPVRRGRRSPSPRRGPRVVPPTHLELPPPTIVPAAHPSIPGTLALPMGFLQFRPSSTVTTVAGFNRMGSRPVENHTARFILARMSHLSQNDDANPLSSSLKSNPHNRLLNIASYPPYHLLHVISRGRLVVSKKSEIRLRLWRAQHPSAPLWFFAIRCLSRGLDWRVFANPQHLVGPLQSISGPRPAYLDHTPPLLTRGYGEFDLYQDGVRDMLRLPFARRFCTMGGLVWRLAMQYGPDNLFSAALSGPSSDAYMHSHSDTIGTDIDDKVMDSHLKLLLGVTVDGQSLWPPVDVFENHMQWEGEWTASLETWFIKHCAMIQSRDTRAFATHSQWSSRLWQHSTTSSRDATRLLTEARAQLLCYDIDQMDPKSFAALD